MVARSHRHSRSDIGSVDCRTDGRVTRARRGRRTRSRAAKYCRRRDCHGVCCAPTGRRFDRRPRRSGATRELFSRRSGAVGLGAGIIESTTASLCPCPGRRGHSDAASTVSRLSYRLAVFFAVAGFGSAGGAAEGRDNTASTSSRVRPRRRAREMAARRTSSSAERS